MITPGILNSTLRWRIAISCHGWSYFNVNIQQRSNSILLSRAKLSKSGYGENTNLVRLSKRMSELNLCSRREAEKLILSRNVRVGGEEVDAVLGLKVNSDEKDIQIIHNEQLYHPMDWENIRGDTVVLNKPLGYLSSPRNSHSKNRIDRYGKESYEVAVSLLKKKRFHNDFGELKTTVDKYMRFNGPRLTLNRFAPAGRLDINSSGVIVFTKSGVIAKSLIGNKSNVEKEYIVRVAPLNNKNRDNKDPDASKDIDLSLLLQDGNKLRPLDSEGVHHQKQVNLQPAVEAKWIKNKSVLKIVLTEGKKHQIRRMCRELLGLQVLSLTRTRIGEIKLGPLPVGKWRPLYQDELRYILDS